ncbi:MAG: 4-(cytidine 5'-diphospho)-2-C-methyl-D-erythritol kinase [Gammaproteobacteria bacterium]|nr:4-(cytidine 5'-diphospho)-2-C-methyl-D-erythritol kinase [Gammaproteobacteria bacterium]NIR98645.1 4-(cytidine 5'-diphospho)-2-C-methyl-D-erythritol kinase [Gammaproteobacteria bacterium]NIT64362.1 4-(cytidine 5'-diphospho)-2-C-methyl-D-erythritol kinase [Gammaproteobacteria bacterium]NIV21294.1 4-(cytidine 5'-diphospho)-2-C-methyl-D-erythritol kinase [Gammaproteobacteria bacterium]NIY32942.1 4-(cytidine 5'-diphospho)-2-C-methyl-D-erythritol kinase [Gammaproteobacteria bacterium]
MKTASWPAPAKLNRFLHITGRRPDGYHTLQTAFQFLDYCDRLDFELQAHGAVRRAGSPAGVPEDQDLTVRAARLLQQAAGTGQGVVVRLHKRLPLGAGLGGGSSDAATALVALNRLWQTGLSTDELAALGLRLGADVPVFVHGRAAWGEGVGERLSDIELDAPWFAVVVPPVAVSTAAVFGDAHLTRNSAPITISDFLTGRTCNDCEAVVVRRYPLVGEALDWLRRRAGQARLTGTGACVYAACADEATARTALSGLPAGWRGFAARGLNRSPLLERLACHGS